MSNVAVEHNSSKDFEDLVYLLSHDVGNSVRALLEVPQWIKEDFVSAGHSMSKPMAENFDLLETQTRRLDRMLSDLLAYSRVGRLQSTRLVDFHEALDLVLDQVSLPRSFRVTHDFQCKSMKFGEHDMLTLLSALISNAIKHHDKSSGHIHLSSLTLAGEIVICVQDDGPGIAEKYRDRVFEAMSTLKPRDEVEGSGMGLAIVRKIVHNHGGELAWIEPDAQFNTALEMRFKIGL
ncbi:sensor histidine kinase [Roseobacter denitrificans]|nr:HAMP domain-containing sensor histidine kinase [Roseobacter denitrificans]